jgi:hypothetical protein
MRTLALLPLLPLLAVALAGCVAPATIPAPLDLPLLDVVRNVSVDPARWSGEPSILALQDGTLLITGAGGMTRYAEDPADAPGNAGQSYLWRSTDGGITWAFVDFGAPAPLAALLPYRNAILGVEGDLAQDEAGRAYFVDLTALVANGLSASDDGGATWLAAQSPLVGQVGVDRPWVAALGEGEVWVKYLQVQSGHRVARSTDGGLTFLEDVELPACGQADFTVDLARQEVLVPCTNGGDLSVLRTARGPQAWERLPGPLAAGNSNNIFPSLAVAGEGQYVFTWAEEVEGVVRVMASASLDAGQTWSAPLQVSAAQETGVFPWVDANPAGQVAVVWYESDEAALPGEVQGPWRAHLAALRLDAQGLALQASGPLLEEPIHEGAICNQGLGCVLNGQAENRRLLDFFEVDVDAQGIAHVAWTTTRTDVPTIGYSQVALPAV